MLDLSPTPKSPTINLPTADACTTTITTTPTSPDIAHDSGIPSATLDTRALAEASRNLTQKLKQLSSEVRKKILNDF